MNLQEANPASITPEIGLDSNDLAQMTARLDQVYAEVGAQAVQSPEIHNLVSEKIDSFDGTNDTCSWTKWPGCKS